jgi:small subunit ribosomal protein S1
LIAGSTSSDPRPKRRGRAEDPFSHAMHETQSMSALERFDDDRKFRPEANLDDDLQKELDEALGDSDSLMDIMEEATAETPASQAAADKGSGSEDKGDQAPTASRLRVDPDGVRRGEVVAVQGDDIFVDLGGKSQGLLPASQYQDDPLPEEGDVVEFTVEGYDQSEGLVMLSRKGAVLAASWENLKRGNIVEGRVTGLNKGGLELSVSGIKAFMPFSMVEMHHVEDFTPYLNRKLLCEVREVKRSENRVLLSHRAVLERQAAEQAEQTLEQIEEGSVVDGTVKTIKPYGAFVDIGGVDGLLHIREMAHGHVDKVTDVVKEGQQIKVAVISIDRDENKIALSLKETLADPWEGVENKYPVDSIVTGRVTRLVDFGAFVELEDGVEGLIPIGEITYERHIKHPSDELKEGDTIRVKVLRVEPKRKRISLSIKQVEGDPWMGAEARWPVNSTVEGNVTRIAEFGAFVQIAPGVEGLVHISELSPMHVQSVRDVVKEGEHVEARVVSVDEDARRIGLSIKQMTEAGQVDVERNYGGRAEEGKKRKRPLKGGLD